MKRFLPVLALCAVAGGAVAAPALPVAVPPAPRGELAFRPVDFKFGSATDDTSFLFRIALLEGHLMVGYELLQAHQPGLALPHFGHPVRELYDDFSDYLEAHKFPAFDTQLAELESAAKAAPESPDTVAKYKAAIETVHKARELAPLSIRDSVPEMIKICSQTVETASHEFGESLDHGRIAAVVEFHDSRGFVAYVAQTIQEMSRTHTDPASASALGKFKEVLAKVQWIVDPLLPGPLPRASVATFRGLAEDAEKIAEHH